MKTYTHRIIEESNLSCTDMSGRFMIPDIIPERRNKDPNTRGSKEFKKLSQVVILTRGLER